jgi:3-deoxy-D-manno-octulosonic-acid transferase
VREQLPEALLVLVPRHPDRFETVAALTGSRQLFCVRRASGQPVGAAQVYLGDTMGELMLMYGAADVAFVGGSLIERGGHNPLEPAAWGIPVITGPHVFNFETVYRQLEDGQGLVRVNDESDLAEQVIRLLSNPQQAGETGRSALAVVEANRGALDRVVSGILSRLGPAENT